MALKSLTRGLPSSGIGIAAGGATFYGHRFANTKIEALRKNFWITPALLAALGHFMKTRKSDLVRTSGASLLGAAGYALAMGYEMSKSAPQPTATETGALVSSADIQEVAALMSPSDFGSNASARSYADAMGL